MRKVLFITFLVLALPLISLAQFNSGSTGADGTLDLSAMTCPGNTCEIQLPESGILNFTTINVPAGKILTFKPNSRNTPVILLAQEAVTIADTVTVSAPQGANYETPGPGGFYGSEPGRNGFGPGGGNANGSREGRWVGSLSLAPIVGGSGGAGLCVSFYGCRKGGGGGGAIIIASSTSITITTTGNIRAIGAGDPANYGGPGSGGAIRLIASSLNIAGQLRAEGANLAGNYAGGLGIVRLEANNLTFTGTSNPLATSAPINPNIISNDLPQLTIASIGGYSVPSYAGSRYDLIDLMLPNQLPDPINVVVSANNIPPGTEIQVGFVNGSSNGTSTPCTLAGTFATSQCTATISNLNRTGGTYLLATAVFTPPASLAEYNPKGENQVAKIKLETSLGRKPRYIFLRTNGSVIEPKNILQQFLQQFGM
jgi:hypothetical protein